MHLLRAWRSLPLRLNRHALALLEAKNIAGCSSSRSFGTGMACQAKEKVGFCDPGSIGSAANFRTVNTCTQLWISSYQNPDAVYKDLSCYLENIDLWITAYQRVCCNMNLVSSKARVDTFTVTQLEALRDSVVSSNYRWGGIGEIYVIQPEKPKELGVTEKPKKKKTPPPTPDFQDVIVQEVLLMILEPIFEPRFSLRSHGYRPGRTPHTCLRYIQGNFGGCIWLMKVDLTDLFNEIEPRALISVIEKVVTDIRILRLIYKGVRRTKPLPPLIEEKLKKGPVKWSKKKKRTEDDPKRNPFWLDSILDFAPAEAQKLPLWGSLNRLCPLLSNIYLHQLDVWMEEQMKAYYRPYDPSKIWPEAASHSTVDEEKAMQSTASSMVDSPLSHDATDNSKRIEYVRHGGYILVGIRGPRADAEYLMDELIRYSKETLGVEAGFEKRAIVHISKPTTFLGHEITKREILLTRRRLCKDRKYRTVKVPITVLSMGASMVDCMRKLRQIGVLKGTDDPQPCFRLFHAEQASTNAHINKLLRAISDWYRYAYNRKMMSAMIGFVFRSSLAKLYAAKYKLRSQAKVYKIGSNDLSRPIKDRKGLQPEYQAAVHAGMSTGIEGVEFRFARFRPEAIYSPLSSDWRPVHERLLREVAGSLQPDALKHEIDQIKARSPDAIEDNMSAAVWESCQKRPDSYVMSSDQPAHTTGDDNNEEFLNSETETDLPRARSAGYG